METVNVYPRQPQDSASPLPGERFEVAPHARPHPWPEMLAVFIACGVVWFSKWAIPAVLFGCVVVAIVGQ